MGEIDYTRMGRQDLIAYCERLRVIIALSAPVTWAATRDVEGAATWERQAARALHMEPAT